MGSTLKKRRSVPCFLIFRIKVRDEFEWFLAHKSLWISTDLTLSKSQKVSGEFQENVFSLIFFSLNALINGLKFKVFNGFGHSLSVNPWDWRTNGNTVKLLSRPPIRLLEKRVIQHQKKAKNINSEKRRKDSPTCSAYLQQMFSLQISTPIIRFLDFFRSNFL